MDAGDSMISFNLPPVTGDEMEYIRQAMESHKISGDGIFTKKCSQWLEKRFSVHRALLTTSGTSALDMAMLLCEFRPGDEVILPSYTFSSTATSAVLAGAKLVFVDIRPDTMNIDETKIEEAITPRTRAVIVVHYAGVACEMDTILDLAKRHHLYVIEDAAQGIMANYKGRPLGTIGDFGCFSFHETKNFSMGEGGALLLPHADHVERAEILREKGTNRSKFFRGQVDKYTWVDIGDSYLPSELNAAYLWAQLQHAEEIQKDRMRIWRAYWEAFRPLEEEGKLVLPAIPRDCEHNAHMFYIKLRDLEERTKFLSFMRECGICSVFHYIPLHSSPAGMRFGRFHGENVYTTRESERLARLPLYYRMNHEDLDYIIQKVKEFF